VDCFAILDVGCNEGDLTLGLYARARAEIPSHVRICVRGIDIDPILTKRATAKTGGVKEGDMVIFDSGDVTDPAVKSLLLSKENPSFDLLSIFSVTLWIHLNGGNSGLAAFLEAMAELVGASGCGGEGEGKKGSLLVEPQDKKSYKTAAKRLRKMKVVAPHQKLSGEDIDNSSLLIDGVLATKFSNKQTLGSEAWGRTLSIYS